MGADAATPSDRALLERWLQRRDAEAFAAHVARHGSMVYATCRRLLGNAAEAEECFLMLAQGEARVRRSVGGSQHAPATYPGIQRGGQCTHAGRPAHERVALAGTFS